MMDTYEKKYNEALERFKAFKEKYYTKNTVIGDAIFDKTGEMQRDFESIFPELAESEDERIRKAIVELLTVASEAYLVESTGIKKDSYLAWLEKQKEPKDPFDDEQFSRGYEAGKHDALRSQVDAFVTEYNKGFEAGRLEGITAGYNKAVKEVDEQKENPKNADSIPADCASNAKCEDGSLKHTDSFGTDIRDTPAYWRGWDDAMKQKEQKPAWSEEDEILRVRTINRLETLNFHGISGKEIRESIDWLKSLRPSWKPSEEQMDALLVAIHWTPSDENMLISLYNDLKKL